MKRLFFLLLIPAMVFSQYRGSKGLSVFEVRAIVADSSLWKASGSTRITTRDGKAVYLDSLIVKYTVITYDSIKNSLRVGGLGGNSTPLTVVGNKTTGNLIYAYNDKDATIDSQLVVTSKAYIGVGTSTPLNRVSIVDKTSGQGTGLHVVSSQWNKARSTWAAAHDTSSIMQYIDSAGGPRWSMKAVDGDSLGISRDATYSKFVTNNGEMQLTVGNPATGTLAWDATQFYPIASDEEKLGFTTCRWKEYWGTDNIYLGGKSQTATMTISGENVIAGTDSALVLSANGGTPTITAMHTGSFTNGGRRFYSGADSVLMNFSKTGRDSASWATAGGLKTTGTYGNKESQAITVVASATTFAVTKNNCTVTGDAGGNTVATITGGDAVGLYIFKFVDDKVTITDTGDGTANTINLSAAFTSAANTMLGLWWNGTSWYECFRSANG